MEDSTIWKRIHLCIVIPAVLKLMLGGRGVELAQRSSNVMDCHFDGPGFKSRSERCIYRASRPSQGTVNGGAVSKWPRCRWDVKHNKQNKRGWWSLYNLDIHSKVTLDCTLHMAIWMHCEEPGCSFETLQGRSPIGYCAALFNVVSYTFSHGLRALERGLWV